MHFGGGQKFLQRDFKEFARGDAHLARQPPMFQRFGKAIFYNGILRRAEEFTTGFLSKKTYLMKFWNLQRDFKHFDDFWSKNDDFAPCDDAATTHLDRQPPMFQRFRYNWLEKGPKTVRCFATIF